VIRHWLQRRITREDREPVTRDDDNDNEDDDDNNNNSVQLFKSLYFVPIYQQAEGLLYPLGQQLYIQSKKCNYREAICTHN
jgi:hypothetical protein